MKPEPCKFIILLKEVGFGWVFSRWRGCEQTDLIRMSRVLKGPKHEKFESGFFTQIRGLWLGELGTGEKN